MISESPARMLKVGIAVVENANFVSVIRRSSRVTPNMSLAPVTAMRLVETKRQTMMVSPKNSAPTCCILR